MKKRVKKKLRRDKILRKAVLCFLIREHHGVEQVCLAKKSEGKEERKIGEGCRNGYGGGIEKGENEKDAVLRELWQEAKVVARASRLVKMGMGYFDNETGGGHSFTCRVSIFTLRTWEGVPTASDEMLDPEWYSLDQLPFEELMAADVTWLPLLLSGKKIIVHANYASGQMALLSPLRIIRVKSF